MKTQLFKLVFALPFFVFFLNTNVHALEYNVNSKDMIGCESLSFDTEEALIIEDWMINDTVWKFEEEPVQEDAAVTSESDMQIENWMSDDEIWKIDNQQTASN